jgi:hypothetical protein
MGQDDLRAKKKDFRVPNFTGSHPKFVVVFTFRFESFHLCTNGFLLSFMPLDKKISKATETSE